MKDWQKFFKGKKITQMGLGLLGRGVGDAAFLAECGAEVVVTDLKTEKELAPSLAKLNQFTNITFHLGGHRLEDFRNRPKPSGDGRRPDFILKAAGVPLDSLFITEARKNKIPIEMDASLFVKLAPKGVTIIGVTGTRGKTTTTMMIYEIVKKFLEVRPQDGKRGLTSKTPRVFLAGNIKDTATLPLFKKVKPGDYVVMELDSWQLQGFGEAKMSLPVAVFTTFYPDHMNYYKNDMRAYFADKANIFKYQKVGDALVAGEGIPEAARRFWGAALPKTALIARAADLPADWRLKVPGEHNRANAACALAAARAIKIPEAAIREALENFAGVQGRLELVGKVNGVQYYNDTTATTPEATVAALSALDPLGKQNVVLIIGGADKRLDMGALREAVHAHAKEVLLIAGTGTDRLCAEASDKQVYDSLPEAVAAAKAAATAGDTVLFSPAFASFGMFDNEYDRGEQFVKLVKSL